MRARIASITTILLDGNIYDKLAADLHSRNTLALLIAKGSVRVIATPIVVKELTKSPFGGVPSWFQVEIEPDAIKHSNPADPQLPDAVIAESAHALADILASEDHGCRWRLSHLGTRCKAYSYRELKSWLRGAPDR